MPTSSDEVVVLNWATTDINRVESLGPVNWEALVQFAVNTKRRHDGYNGPMTCQLSAEYNMGGLNLVRRLDFQDGTRWVARLQLRKPTVMSAERLLREVHTMAVVRERSRIPVPEVYAYDANCSNPVGVLFMIMEFIPGSSAMDSFGGFCVHHGETPWHFKPKYHATMADIQAQMSAIRFPKIGSIVKCHDGTYSVGPLPGIGGPFDSAAHFFEAWVAKTRFPCSDEVIRARTPPELVDEVMRSIREFLSRFKEFAQLFHFGEGPFPLFHTDLYKSNVIIDSQYNILSVIDWEHAIVAPWEIVKFPKDLAIVPPAMDGPLYNEDEATRRRLTERREYVELVREAERARGLDNCLSATLENAQVQDLGQAIWLYEDGRVGFYGHVLDQILGSFGFSH